MQTKDSSPDQGENQRSKRERISSRSEGERSPERSRRRRGLHAIDRAVKAGINPIDRAVKANTGLTDSAVKAAPIRQTAP